MKAPDTITVPVHAKLLTKQHGFRVRLATQLCRLASWLASADVEITVNSDPLGRIERQK